MLLPDAWLALLRAQHGDLAGAGMALEAALRRGVDTFPDDVSWSVAIAMLLETAILVDLTNLPTRLTEVVDQWPFPRFYNGNGYQGATARLRGTVAHLTGNDDRALAHYEQVITDHRTLGAVPWIAETHLDQAQLWLDRGEPERAASSAQGAVDVIGDLTLVRRRDRAAELLARIN